MVELCAESYVPKYPLSNNGEFIRFYVRVMFIKEHPITRILIMCVLLKYSRAFLARNEEGEISEIEDEKEDNAMTLFQRGPPIWPLTG